ncbi:MAG: 1,4-alpha-glucan branching protein GlgB [Sorangiineae bacterium]|nr:1,4-alpha-glucan branching protein GlgB [Polyangiaceae bacterium]MEB2322723.1 1,4-alpha-glucan branching protein GlgB [Sorangiineae bacterium]
MTDLDRFELERLARGGHHEPHRILGAHVARRDGVEGTVVRAFHPDAQAATLQLGGEPHPMTPLGEGVFEAFVPRRSPPLAYRLEFHFADGNRWTREDPYRFLPTVGELDLYLFGEGTHRRLWEMLGARVVTMEGVEGVAFAVWAPNARRVSVVGDFNGWDGRLMPMRSMGSSGVWELFVPGVGPGALYKFELETAAGLLRTKTDPMAREMEHPPHTASRVERSSFAWTDSAYLADRATRDITREPVSVYEVHLGSWARVPEEGNRSLRYRELAPRLVEHAKRFGFTHLELMPIEEHPLTASWGYQVTGYYAPTSRYGSPDDFRWFVDYCHQHGLGVILDWVPAHFPKDDFALRRFDGSALYEHDDPRRGEHPDWGTLIFNLGRAEVRNFLMANALYWLEEFHIDGLRVDAVASMLYLDYSRKDGEWLPNPYGGRENLDAIDFLRATNTIIKEELPGAFTVAEESTSWPGVTRSPDSGGLGFTFKWNMGWMHDTLLYFSRDPVHRKFHQDNLTFSMLYEFTERFINAISHDEVVHGKRSLIEKMPGDTWQKFSNLRALITYQYTRPGKNLLFMGAELAQWREWDFDSSLDWHLSEDPERRGLALFFEELGALYLERACFWQSDPDPYSFHWIDCNDRENSVLCYERRGGDQRALVVMNLTPVPRESYRIGAPLAGRYVERFNSDDSRYGGSSFETFAYVDTEPVPMHGFEQSLGLRLPPLGVLVLVPG